jgi:hypothetical protein
MQTPSPPVFLTGLDLRQTTDPTALAVLERTAIQPAPAGRRLFRYVCRHLERWPLGTSYPDIVARVKERFAAPPLKGSRLVVDNTGVGRAVVDMLRQAKVTQHLHPVTITSGFTVTFESGSAHVPKKDLVGVLQVLLQTRRFQVVPTLPEAATLLQELQNFRVKVTAAGNDAYAAWRENLHDDLVLAVAIAAWWGERSRRSR